MNLMLSNMTVNKLKEIKSYFDFLNKEALDFKL